MTQNAGKGPMGLWIIGAFKVVSAVLLIALGVGVFRNVHSDLEEEAEHIVSALKLDPGNYYVHAAIAKLSGVTVKQLRLIGVGTFAYALLYLIEGVGLLLKKHWAEYFTVIATGSLIPLEIYEVARRLTPIRVGVLAINVAIVAYLVYVLVNRPKEDAAAGAGAAP